MNKRALELKVRLHASVKPKRSVETIKQRIAGIIMTAAWLMNWKSEDLKAARKRSITLLQVHSVKAQGLPGVHLHRNQRLVEDIWRICGLQLRGLPPVPLIIRQYIRLMNQKRLHQWIIIYRKYNQ